MVAAIKIYRDDIHQFYEILPSGFNGKEYLRDGADREELIEMAFISLTKVNRNSDSIIEKIDFQGTNRGVMDSDSFYTLLSYGYSGKIINRALKGTVELKGDAMSSTVLGLLLNNTLDE